ncbi:MAG: TonB-dependent receptor [Endomicrobiales bacterium]|nr:TonB-dependent receptor [Endomicrobiales bacterium]
MDIPSVVTASKVSEKLSDAPGVVSVITADEMKRFGGTTLFDVLQRVPSLVGSSIYMTDRSVISARGDQFNASGSHVLLLINGRPIREVEEGGIVGEVLETFPVTAVERIEVIRGPGSVLYGSNAFSGVINVITKKADRTGATLALMGGTGSAFDEVANVMYSSEDFNFTITGKNVKKPDWDVKWEYDEMYPPTFAPTGNVFSKDLTIPNNGNGTFLDMNYKNLRFMSSYNEYQTQYYIPDYMALFNACGISYWSKVFANLGYTMEMSDAWSMDINTTYSRSLFRVSDWPDTSRDSYESLIEWTNYFTVSDKFRIVAGGLYDAVKGGEYIEGSGQVSGGDSYNYSLYSQADYWAHDKVKIIAGAQANKDKNVDDMDIVPRAGLIVYPVENTNVKILYSSAFRAPSLNERFMNFVALAGKADIKAEKVSTVDIGVNYHKDNLLCGVNYFNAKQTNIIEQDRSGKYAIPTYDNIGEIKAQGFELEGKYYFSKEFLSLVSVLYQTNENAAGVEDVTPIPNTSAKLGLSYQADSGVTLSLFDAYQGALDSKFDTLTNTSPDAYNLASLHGRFNMTKLAGWNIGRDFSFLLQIDNLLDKEIWLPNWGLIAGSSLPVSKGRTVYFGVEIAL